MALTKSTAEVDAWAEVAQNSQREGAVADISGCYAATLHVDVALSSTTAHTGTEIIVQIGTDTGDADDNWTNLSRWIGPIGTAVKADFAGSEAQGQTVLSVTNPATANMDNDGKFKFVEDTGSAANSEIVWQVSNSGDSSDTITVLDGISHAKDANDDIFDIDDATQEAVGQYQIELPMPTDRARVIINNKYDPDGSTVHTRTRISKVTAI